MELGPVLDEEKTVQVVRDFFTKDDFAHRKNYDKIKRNYYAVMGISAPMGDVTGIHGSGGNHVEEKWLGDIPYAHAMKCISRGIHACPYESQVILLFRYCDHQTIDVTMREAQIMSSGSYYTADHKACYRFADAMDSILSKADDETRALFPDFLVWKPSPKVGDD